MKLAKEFLWDYHVEHGTVIYEQDACICVIYEQDACIYVRRLQVLHHKVQGQATRIISVSVVHVGELEWIHIGVGDRLQMRKDCHSLQHLHHYICQNHGAVVVQRVYLSLLPCRTYGRCLKTQRNSVLMERGAK